MNRFVDPAKWSSLAGKLKGNEEIVRDIFVLSFIGVLIKTRVIQLKKDQLISQFQTL